MINAILAAWLHIQCVGDRCCVRIPHRQKICWQDRDGSQANFTLKKRWVIIDLCGKRMGRTIAPSRKLAVARLVSIWPALSWKELRKKGYTVKRIA